MMAEYDRLAGIKGRFVRWLRYEPRADGDVMTLDADEVAEVVDQLQYAVDTILRQRQELHDYKVEVRRLNMQLNRASR
jgi:hypothetical protein